MIFTVYVLFSQQFNKHYTGYTSDIQMRLLSHNEFGKDWTSKYRPWILIYTREFLSKEQALQYEKWLKSGAGRDFIHSLKI